MTVIETLAIHKIIPVIELDAAESAVPLAAALTAGGLPVAEVTLRTAAAIRSIAEIARQYPQFLVGAGTVISAEQCRLACDAGAKFIITPGLAPGVIELCRERGIPVIPGVSTPSEIIQALEFGLTTVKFFPAVRFGGIGTIKAYAGPFPQVRFIPTGGVNMDNVVEYLACETVVACGGSWMVNKEYLKAKRFADIASDVKRTVSARVHAVKTC